MIIRDNVKAQRNVTVFLAVIQLIIVVLCVIDVMHHEASVRQLLSKSVIAAGLIYVSINRIRKCREQRDAARQ